MNAPVITVTLNPAIDQTVNLGQLRCGEVNIAGHVTLNAGGKGVNVAGCLADWGTPVIATGILGQDNAAPFDALFGQKDISNRFILQPGNTRTNIKVVSAQDGSTTDINLPGLAVSAMAYTALLERLDDLSEPGRMIALCGSLPAGLSDDTYATLVTRLHRHGVRVLLDTSGAALGSALSASTLPYCIKPNQHELEQWAGRPLSTLDDIVACARRLQRQGVAQVIVSLAERGALFVGAREAWLATPPPVTPQSSVGAGDALVAGWLAGQYQGRDIQASLRLALAFAAGKLQRIGPHLPSPDDVERLAQAVTLQRIQGE